MARKCEYNPQQMVIENSWHASDKNDSQIPWNGAWLFVTTAFIHDTRHGG